MFLHTLLPVVQIREEVFFEPLETTSINYVILLPHLTPPITYLESKVIPRTVWELEWLSMVDT